MNAKKTPLVCRPSEQTEQRIRIEAATHRMPIGHYISQVLDRHVEELDSQKQEQSHVPQS